MDIQQQENRELQTVAELVKEIRFAMMTAVDESGILRSRPMTTMQMDASGDLWFFTALSSPQANDADHQRQLNLNYARTDKQDYLSISGAAEIVRDRQKMEALWTPWIEPWFPQGLDDPDLVLMKVTIEEAEYWDAPGSSVKRLYGLAKGLATGKTDAMGENRKILM